MRQRYPQLWQGQFPTPQTAPPAPYETVSDALPWHNRLTKQKPRLLLIVPWLAMGGSDKFNLDLLGPAGAARLGSDGCHNARWRAAVGGAVWPLYARDLYPRPFSYARQITPAFYALSSTAGMSMPCSSRTASSATSSCPICGRISRPSRCSIFAIWSKRTWKNGGYPHLSATYQEMLDRHLVSSAHLKGWIENRGVDPQLSPSAIRISTLTIGSPTLTGAAVPATSSTLPKQRPSLCLWGACAPKSNRQSWPTRSPGLRSSAPILCSWWRATDRILTGSGLLSSKGKLEPPGPPCSAPCPQRRYSGPAGRGGYFLSALTSGRELPCRCTRLMACGVPVVGADVGGQAELVTPDCGVLIGRGAEEDEAEQYATALAGNC